MNDEQILIYALFYWFESQNIRPGLAIPAMANVCGAWIDAAATDKDDLQLGFDSFQVITAHSANLAFEALHDR